MIEVMMKLQKAVRIQEPGARMDLDLSSNYILNSVF